MMSRSPVDKWLSEEMSVSLEALTQEKVEQYHLKKLQKLVGYLKQNSNFYKIHLQNFDPDDIATIEDFKKLPLTQESDLAGQEWRFQCVVANEVSRIVTVPTTGTQGNRKRIAFSKKDLERAHRFSPPGFAVMCNPKDKILVLMSGDIPGSIGDSIIQGLKYQEMDVCVYGIIRDIQHAEIFIREFCPDVIVAVPIQAAILERYMRDHGEFHVKSVLLSADDVPESLCERLRHSWGCRTYRHYGMTELCMFGAVECQAANGYHMRSADHFFEILEPDKDGYGEIAVTTFRHEAMPLLRYKTGDIGCMIKEKCNCGSPLYRLGDIKGRINNSFMLPTGRLFLRDIAEAVYEDDSVVDYECNVGKRKISIVVKVMPNDVPDIAKIKSRISRIAVLKDVYLEIKQEIQSQDLDDCKLKKRMGKDESVIFDGINLPYM